MKEELEKKLVEILGWIQENLSKTTEFAVQNLPDIAQQYLTYGRVYHTTIGIVSLVILILCIYATIKIYKKNSTDLAICVFLPASLFSFLIFCGNVSALMLVWAAPKVWIIKEIAGLLK